MLKLMQYWQLFSKVHISWLFAFFSVAFVIGVMLAQYELAASYSSPSWVILAFILVGLGTWKRIIALLPFIVVAGILLGVARGAHIFHQRTVYENILGQTVSMTGKVVEDPDVGKRGETVLRLKEISIGKYIIVGGVWVTTASNVDIRRSDIVTVKGKLSEGFGNFDASIYRAKIEKVERPEPGDLALVVRDWFADGVRQTISEPQVSLGLGYLLGLRRALPPELDEALVIAGLTHVVVASGYNLTILVRIARRVFIKISKYMSVLAAGLMITAFIAVTGMSPSMSRAGLVAGLSLAAWYFGRKFHPLVLLPFAAGVTVLINPAYAWNDLGWQLSFTAFAGVMILAPLLQRYLYGGKKPGTLRQILGETVGATIMTMPILILSFGQISNVAIIANLLVLPLVPLSMLLTFIAGVVSMAVPATTSYIGMPAEWLLMYMTTVANFLADLPWALTIVEIQPWMTVAMYIVISLCCVYLWRKTKYDLRDSNIIE